MTYSFADSPMRRSLSVRLPAEWEPQDAVLISWPHEETDWAPCLKEAETVFLNLAEAVTQFQKLLIAVRDKKTVARLLEQRGVRMDRVALFETESNDTWARDFGPITVYQDEKPVLLDFTFNGWGGKFDAAFDNRITGRLHEAGAFGDTPRCPVDWILEGGSIESDGRGTILTTSECLLNPNRNPGQSRAEIEKVLSDRLGAERFLWLENGRLTGDDTDAHIDTLARFCSEDTIAYVQCTDPLDEHFPALTAMEEELKTFRTAAGKPYRLIPLPLPAAEYDPEGNRLPATYANFLIINHAVLLPVYRDPDENRAASAALEELFPGREIIEIDGSTLISQHGSLHCVTMQIPEGVIR